MKKTMLAVMTTALAVFLCACPSAKTSNPTSPTGPVTPSGLVVALDAVEVSTAAAAPWFPGSVGAWLTQVMPTAMQIAVDLQQPNPFAQAQAIDATLRVVIASAPAQATMSADQQKMAASVIGAVDAFLLIYEQQAGLAPAPPTQLAAMARGIWRANAADMVILKNDSRGK